MSARAVDVSDRLGFHPGYVGAAILPAALLVVTFARTYADPLRHIPGPFIARFTAAWLWVISWKGIECRTIAALHKRYGPVVRIAPNEVDISDGAAVNPVYIRKGGFPKSPIYRNYDVLGFPTIFSVLDTDHRAIRAKAVAPMFAQHLVTQGRLSVQPVVDTVVTELGRRRYEAHGRPVDVLDLFRALAMDMTTVYLTGESFNGVGRERFSAADFIDNFVDGGRLFHLPAWLFNVIDKWAAKLNRNKSKVEASDAVVKEFAARVVDRSIDDNGDDRTYQGRLLKAGISREETIAQLVDVMFAGTDAAASTMSMLCWYLGRCSQKYETVRKEVLDNPDADPQSLPYLSGVVKEALRLTLANPTRLPRIVPPEGLHIPGLPPIPGGTSVGVSAFVLHHNQEVFPKAHHFLPERWLEQTPEMVRDSMYFGQGSRQCIARNLAAAGLWWTAESLIRSDVLRGGKPVKENTEIREWFNARIVDGKVEMQWQ